MSELQVYRRFSQEVRAPVQLAFRGQASSLPPIKHRVQGILSVFLLSSSLVRVYGFVAVESISARYVSFFIDLTSFLLRSRA
jgi:hypothetical protein